MSKIAVREVVFIVWGFSTSKPCYAQFLKYVKVEREELVTIITFTFLQTQISYFNASPLIKHSDLNCTELKENERKCERNITESHSVD